ncbi:MAG TPA: hypothetical protein VGV59_12945 [Pyrinomonadaceae bacterium]|nr:hypothetical protein [Pyrinomonadaceae bacterium]
MRLRHLLLIATCVHLTAATGAHLAGRWGVAAGTFGDGGIASFASDSRVYRLQIVALEETLKEEGAAAWLRSPAPVHVKLYSLSFSLFSPLFGQSILSAAPLNLIYYLTTLLLVFALGSEAFGRREGLLAAWMTAALLPSFLLHTTQLLKDPLFVVLALTLVLVSVKWLTTPYTLAGGLLAGALGGAAAASLWLVKSSAWWVVLAIMFLGAALSIARQAHSRTLHAANLAGVALMLAIGLSASQFITPYWLPKEYWMPHRPGATAGQQKEQTDGRAHADSTAGVSTGSTAEVAAKADPQSARQTRTLSSRVAERIAQARAQFIELYPDAGSNLDADVRFGGMSDVILYLPRAVLVGLCAPFPVMWFDAGGNVGTAGRLLSGGETLLMYFVELLAFVCLWHRRRQMTVWLLVLVSLIGATALGLVVVNVGALYRQRYLFWILLIVVGAGTVARMLPARFARATDDRLV